MSLRDEQDFEERQQKIIDGALHVFASKGFEKATNKDIAAAAGIGSPGLIYHYFKDKSDLFQQVVAQRMPVLQLLHQADETLMGKTPREVLTTFAKAFLQDAENPTSMALLRLLLGDAFRQPHVAELINTIGPSRSIGFLTRYLEKQMGLGMLKPMDARAAARCFMGPLIAYLITREVFLQVDAQQLSPDTMAATAVEIFLTGMQTRSPD